MGVFHEKHKATHCAFRNTRASPTKSQRIVPCMWGSQSTGRVRDAIQSFDSSLGVSHVSHVSLIFSAPLHCQRIFRKALAGYGMQSRRLFRLREARKPCVKGQRALNYSLFAASLGRLSHVSHVSDVSHTFCLPLVSL